MLAELGYGQIINCFLSLPWQSSIPHKEYIPTFFPIIAGRADENPSKRENYLIFITLYLTFKKHSVNIANDLVKKLPDPTGKFGIPSVHQYYKGINFREEKLKFGKVNSVNSENVKGI